MKKEIYHAPYIKIIRMDTYEDIANGNLLIHSRETDQPALGKEHMYDDDMEFDDEYEEYE